MQKTTTSDINKKHVQTQCAWKPDVVAWIFKNVAPKDPNVLYVAENVLNKQHILFKVIIDFVGLICNQYNL